MTAPEPFRQQLLDTLPRVRRYARSLAYDHATADDLVQTTALRALSHWHQFDQRRDIRVWLLSIAHNAHLDRLRRDQRYTVVDPEQLAERYETPAPGDPGLRMDLLAALGRLSAAHREVLLLVGVEQLSYAECAEVLGVPAGTVMSRLARARVAMRAALEGGAARADTVPNLRRVI